MNGVYTNLAKKRVEQSKEPLTQGSVPPLSETSALHEVQDTTALKIPRKLDSKEAKKHRTVEPAALEAQKFDLNILPYKNHTFSFTIEELEAMEDLKTELRRRLDLRVTKIDIIRSALHTIIADYRQRSEKSFIVERIKTKKGR
jgi:hypothetical protein